MVYFRGLTLALSLSVSTAAAAGTLWVPAAAHTPGVGTSRWRTDLAVLNSCPTEAVVEIRLHAGDEVLQETFIVASEEQQIFTDVVALLTPANTSGALEVVSEFGVNVTSRTYNQSSTGTFGVGLDGVTPQAGFDTGATAFLQQLREDGSFRTNIGALNMAPSPAIVSVELIDRTGALVGDFQLEIPPGETVQDNRPFRRRFGRSNIVGGYARLRVDSGTGVYPYATVIDNATGDPTAVLPRSDAECPVDVAEALQAIEGMRVRELQTGHEGYRFFELHYEQPADHDDPDGEQFEQYMTLLHRSYSAPMVLRTLGYRNLLGDRKAELTGMLDANQLVVEHRFFATSTPFSGDWRLLDIRQAAADDHRIAEALRPLYSGAWINTGHSKGGMTAVFHRRFYPEDVDATVAYVAPLSFGAPDDRYLEFLANAGTPECNQDLWALQREALSRREALLDLLEAYADNNGYTYDRMGGLGPAFESIVMELPFTFWQYAGEGFCSMIPSTSTSDMTIFNFLRDFVGWAVVSDPFFDIYAAYFFQAHDELGFPAVATDHLDDLMLYDPPSPEEGVPPPGSNPSYDPSGMEDISQWVATEGKRLIFIYGQFDPWTAGAFDLGVAADSFRFVDPGGTHGARIGTLQPADREAVMDILYRWTGIEPSPPTAAKRVLERFPPWGRVGEAD
jgi:hypothetical protein